MRSSISVVNVAVVVVGAQQQTRAVLLSGSSVKVVSSRLGLVRRRNQQNPQSPFRSHEVILVWRRAHGESCEQHLGSLRGADSFCVPKAPAECIHNEEGFVNQNGWVTRPPAPKDPSGGSFKPLPLMRRTHARARDGPRWAEVDEGWPRAVGANSCESSRPVQAEGARH